MDDDWSDEEDDNPFEDEDVGEEEEEARERFVRDHTTDDDE